SPERALLFPLGGCIPRRVRSGDFGIHRGIFRFRSFPVARFTTFALIPRLRPAPLPPPPVSTIGSLSHHLDTLRQRRFLHLAFHELFDGRKTPAVAAVHKRDGRTRGFSTGGTSNSVDVIFWIGRYVIIDNQIDSHYVDAPRKHIGTDKDGQLLVLETQQYLFPFFLRQVRMERLHGQPQLGQFPPQALDLLFG